MHLSVDGHLLSQGFGYVNRSARAMDAYTKGLTPQQAQWPQIRSVEVIKFFPQPVDVMENFSDP